MITVFAVGCAVAAALAINYALFMQKRVVEVLPTIEMRLSWTTFKAFLTNTTWLLSITVTLVGGAFYAVAIAIAPISVVQPVVSSGVAFLAYLAINNLGEKPRKVDLYAIAGTILGVILIGVSLAEGIPESVKHDPVELWLFAGFVVLVAVLVPLIMKNTTGNRKAASLGIAAGLLFGVAAIMARLLLVDWTNQWSLRGAGVLFSSIFLVVWALALLPGFITVQAALQRGAQLEIHRRLRIAAPPQQRQYIVSRVRFHNSFHATALDDRAQR